MSYIHFRKGPTKVYIFGVFQPISDAVKLFSKGFVKGYFFYWYFFSLAPLLGLFLIIILWAVYGSFMGDFGRFFSLLYVFSVMSLGVYFFLLCCWGGNRLYSLLGGYRSVSQTVSYEISLVFIVLFFVFFFYIYYFFFFFFSNLAIDFFFWEFLFFFAGFLWF